MQKRTNLKTSILLYGESDGKKFERTFTIIKKIEEGASSVCYEACHENSGRGVLKEFYPCSICGLNRNAAGQIMQKDCSDDDRKAFERAKQEYIEPYQRMLEIKRTCESSELESFIPDFEIYYGCEALKETCENKSQYHAAGTVYIWMPRPRLETFDKICGAIHKHPSVNPERSLVSVLSAVKYLTECIRGLHQENLLHRDIKPSNFGFLRHGDEILEQTLSMFDMNSICSVYRVPEGIMGTEGYMEPEAGYEHATNQTDLYAIGATLFHAVIVSEEVKQGNYLYKDDYYDRLKEMVDSSRLIQASEANSHPRLRNMLKVILQKCLCTREMRYKNCEELLEDIDQALYYALPSELAGKNRSGEKWALVDVERFYHKNREKKMTLALQYHLYEHPLYQCAKNADIHVLIIGFGNYGQKFLDACLPIGRLGDHDLNVTIVSDDVMDMQIYLQERPGLSEFFTGSLVWDDEHRKELALKDGTLGQFFAQDDASGEDAYGKIVFQVTKLERTDQKANKSILENVVMYDHCDTNYVFIALGEDGQNLAAAKACQSAADDLGMDCVIHYVQEHGNASEVDTDTMTAIDVNADVRKSAHYSEIERMAFNTHLIWEKNLHVDFGKVRAEYRKPYNHYSCVTHVVAVKYWLHGMGIDLGSDNDQAAETFAKKVFGTGPESLKLKKELIWLEHARWVTEKLCLGWQRMEDMEACMDGTTKDERKKRHICIQKSSRTKQSLAEICKKDSGYWDNKKAALDELDELDRMSVQLHRRFAEKAKSAREKDLLNENGIDNRIEGIRDLAENNYEAAAAFDEWFRCLKDIWHGEGAKISLYEGLKDRFLQSTDSLPDSGNIKIQVKAFEKMFYPVLASMKYEDYKQKDVDFIDNIPFILTYTENIYLAVPFDTGDNTAVFGNVASAEVVSPACILYLCFLRNNQNEQRLLDTIPRIAGYMEKRRMRAKVEFLIGYTNGIYEPQEEKLARDIQTLAPERIRQIKFIQADEEGLEAAFGAYLVKRKKKGRVIAVEKKQAGLFDVSFSNGFYQQFASFRFDSAGIEFSSIRNCSLVQHIRKRVSITVEDLVALRCSSGIGSRSPEFYKEYEKLWGLYRNRSSVWKGLCNKLAEYAKNNDKIVSFAKKEEKSKTEEKIYRYIIPSVCRKAVSDILDALKEKEIAEAGSGIKEYTTASCRVFIADRCGYRNLYDTLFANIYALMMPDAVKTDRYNENEVSVWFDNLAVCGLSLGAGWIDFKDLLEDLQDMGYVIDLKMESDDKVSFVHASREIKELLTIAGKILEIYVYHKVKDSGKFDDIVSGYEIDWEKTEVKNELDCIMTKGFRTFFIECKAKNKIEADFYTKLASLAQQFGIHPIAVMVTDTRDEGRSNLRAKDNKILRKRGDMMQTQIVTIWKLDEIEHIDETLKQILYGSYKSEK